MKLNSANIAHNLVKYRLFASLLTLCAMCILIPGIKQIQYSSEMMEFFDRTANDASNYLDIEDQYSSLNSLIYVLDFSQLPDAVKQPSTQGDITLPLVLTTNNLQIIDELTALATQVPHTLRVNSLTNTQYTSATSDELFIDALFEEPARLSKEELAERKEFALSDQQISKRYIGRNPNVTAIYSVIDWPDRIHLDELNELNERALAFEAYAEQRYPGLKVYLTGSVMLEQAAQDSASRDLFYLFPLIILAALLIVWLLIRSLSIILVTTFVLLLVVLQTAGAAGYMGLVINQSSAQVAILIFIISSSQIMHLLLTYSAELNQNHSKQRAMHASIRSNFFPVILTTLTTLTGFLSLNIANSPVFSILGNLTSLGMCFSFVATFCLLPACIMMLPQKNKPHHDFLVGAMEKFCGIVIRHSKWVLIPSCILTVVFGFCVNLNKFDHDMLHFFAKDHPARISADFATSNMGDRQQIYFSIDTGRSGGINEPEFLTTLNDFESWLREQDEVSAVFSYLHVMKRLNILLGEGDSSSNNGLPVNSELAAQYLLAYEMSLPFGQDLSDVTNTDRSATRVAISTHYLDDEQITALNQRALFWLDQHYNANLAPKQFHILSSSQDLLFAQLGKDIQSSMTIGSIVALLSIAIILAVGIGSLKYGLLSLIPNLIPPLIGYGVWGLLISEVNVAVAVTLSISMGIIVDDTVHILSKYRSARSRNLSVEDALYYVYRRTGPALLATSTSLVAGYFVLGQSDYGIHSTIGQVVGMIIGIAFFFDFIFLPALIMFIAKNSQTLKQVQATLQKST